MGCFLGTSRASLNVVINLHVIPFPILGRSNLLRICYSSILGRGAMIIVDVNIYDGLRFALLGIFRNEILADEIELVVAVQVVPLAGGVQEQTEFLLA